jgi:N6-L-threonylcarbamoyladenine synthase
MINKDITILSIETSCDETAAAVVLNGRNVLSSVIYSQTEIHSRFGGVVPEIASRNHTIKINETAERALEEAQLGFGDIDAVAVTMGAGLSGALLVGISYAKAVSYALGLPLIAVNHIQGHIAANYISHKDFEPPFICLVVSGGHTALLNVKSYTGHTLLGQTADDAVGEAFDKAARVLDLGYPGGPLIDKAAKTGNVSIRFPQSSVKGFDFSYSGLKTALINYVNKAKQKNEKIDINDVCASFQSAAIDVLVEKSVKACCNNKLKKLCVAGGVSANSYLRERLKKICPEYDIKLFMPDLKYCTDNAAMIGAQGYYNYISGKGLADMSLSAQPHLQL